MDKHSTSKNGNGQRLRKWAENKNPFFAHFAISSVAGAANFHNIIKALHEANIHSQLSRSDIDEWLETCKKSRKMIKYTMTVLASKYGPVPLLNFKPINLLTRAAYSDKPNQQKRVAKYMENISDDNFEQIGVAFKDHMRSELNDLIENLTSKKTSDSDEEETTIEGSEFFLFNNYLMCLIEYNEHFTLLYRKARLGNYDAIKKLVRIDPILMRDPFINHHFITAKPSVSSKLKAAYNNPLKYHTKASKVKVSICGLLSAFTEVTGGGVITPKELRDLFYAYAVDVCHKPDDEHLPDEPEAFRKAVKRHHKLWLPIISGIFK